MRKFILASGKSREGFLVTNHGTIRHIYEAKFFTPNEAKFQAREGR